MSGVTDKKIKPIVNYKKFKQYFVNNKLAPVFIEQGGVNILEFSFKEHQNKINNLETTFIFGNESFGIDLKLIKYCSDLPGFAFISIPQHGMLKSYNVSISAGIVLWEYYRNTL